jgi:hypothetical protein
MHTRAGQPVGVRAEPGVATSAHPHLLVRTRRAARCDVCARDVESSLACRACDFDLCHACLPRHEMKLAEAPAALASDKKDPAPERKRSGRGGAKMFHFSNGRQLFEELRHPQGPLPTLPVTPPLLAEMCARSIALGASAESDVAAAKEFGFEDAAAGAALLASARMSRAAH